MSRFPLEETERKVGSKYSAVIAIGKRALRANQRFLDAPSSQRSNPLRSAMEDILTGRVRVIRQDETSQEEPEGEKEREE